MAQLAINLSLIVPVRNGADRLPAHLAALREFLCAQTRPAELILVDDHSDAATAGLLADCAGSAPGVRLLRNEVNRGKGF